MTKFYKILIPIIFILSFSNISLSKDKFVNEGMELFKDKKNEEKNLETTLLIDPANEEAILMLMEIGIEKTNYSKVKELSERFSKVCINLCKENKQILKDLENLEPKNES